MVLTFSVMILIILDISTDEQLNQIAYKISRGFNFITKPIALLKNKINTDKLLESKATIGCLLLQHHHRCQEVSELCCFTFTDSNNLINKKNNRVTKLASRVIDNKDRALIEWLMPYLPYFPCFAML